MPYLLFTQGDSQAATVDAGAYYRLISVRSGKALDVRGSSTEDGAAVIQYPGQGSANQRWKLVKVAGASGGGGYVTGLVFNQKQKGLLYARTDVGSAYRWDTGAQQWIPLTDWVGERDWNLLGIDSLAADPVAPDRLYLGAGMYTNGWADDGELPRSTDQGRTFERTELPFKLGGNEDGRGAGERLAIDPGNHSTLLLSTRKNGLGAVPTSA